MNLMELVHIDVFAIVAAVFAKFVHAAPILFIPCERIREYLSPGRVDTAISRS
jgi:hypothetical protein